jgi:hypothetical protein
LQKAAPPGPLLVMIGHALADAACAEMDAGGEGEDVCATPPAGRQQVS